MTNRSLPQARHEAWGAVIQLWQESKAFVAIVLLMVVLPLHGLSLWTGNMHFAAAVYVIAALGATVEVLYGQRDRIRVVRPWWRLVQLLVSLNGGMAAGAGLVLQQEYRGIALVVLVAVGAFTNDAGAQFVGSKWGQRWPYPLFPVTSKNKTVVGGLGGLVMGWVCGAVVYALIDTLWMPLPVHSWLIVVTTPFLAVAGDWVESRLKRGLKIKDMGQGLGSHGGVSDRIDAIAAALLGAWFIT